MAEGVMKFAVDKIEEVAARELRLQTEVGKKVAALRQELEWLRIFLRDADGKRRRPAAVGSELIEVWVRQTREVAHDAEDLIEEFVHEGELHCHGCLDLPSFLQWLRHSAAGVFTRHAIFDHIKAINERIDEVKKQRQDLKLERLSTASKPHRKDYSDWIELNETNIAEKEYNIWPEHSNKDIDRWIRDKDTGRLTVVAFTGKSGIGKTALAKFFFGRSYVREEFECAIWVHVPAKFRFVDLLRQIVDKASAGGDVTVTPAAIAAAATARETEESIKGEMAAALGEKRYLIVLDDVRCLEEWNFFLAALPATGNGSCVLVTTQLPRAMLEVEEEPGKRPGYCIKTKQLEKLGTEQAWQLLCKRVYGNDKSRKTPIDVERKEKLLEGMSLPLNVVMLAGLLRSKKEDEWHDVIETLARSSSDADESQEKRKKAATAVVWDKKPMSTGKILTTSMDDLPPYLKPCFLYFAGFTAEAPIDGRRLVRMWVAEGFLQPRNGHTMEERGMECLKELISRCLVRLVETDAAGNIVDVTVHQTVLDFAQAEAHEINFLQVDSSTARLSRGDVRRLALRNTYDSYLSVIVSAPKLHSFICDIPESTVAGGGGGKKLWKRARGFIRGRAGHTFSVYHSRFLRVMDLKGVQHRHTLPEEIGWLIHLRYLGLSHTSVRRLPDSVRNLQNLQTLDVSRSPVDGVPRQFWRIPTLRHVLAGKLRKGPKEYHPLTDVQTLHGVKWGRWARSEAAIKRMTNLRSLKAWGIPAAAAGGALLLALAGLECLRSLDLELDAAGARGGDGAGEAEFPLHQLLDMLGLRQLQYLRLHGKVAKTEPPLPGHQYVLPNLSKVELCESRCSQAHINLLARLPNLVELVLDKSSYADANMVAPADGFPKLRKLELVDLPELAETLQENEVFSSVKLISSVHKNR